jgi:hypothetical protein
MFEGSLVSTNTYSITVKLTSKLPCQSFHVTNIYGPADPVEKPTFISWLYNLDTSAFGDWILMGDFNLIRSPQHRSRPGGNFNEMLLFNDLIHHIDLVEISFQSREFTWRNMQANALLEKLDWVSTSSSWTLSYPDTKVLPHARPILNHTPYVTQINTQIPKSPLFRFENY